MKILHSAFMLRPPLGVITQMRWEQEAAHENHLDWTTRLFCPAAGLAASEILVPAKSVSNATGASLPRRVLNWISLRREYYQWLQTQAAHYDVVLLRYSVCDPFLALYARKLSRPFYTVNHTLEVAELRNADATLSGSLRAAFEQVLGTVTLKQASGIVGVTDEILHYEQKRIAHVPKTGYVYPNGIHYPKSVPESEDLRTAVPELLFVASHFAPWHGLDLLLDSLQGCNAPFVLHLVGTLNPKDQTKALSDSRVKMHGLLGNAQINELSKKCWLGLSSFALDRKNMSTACTLKVREYLLNGLPVYSGHNDVFAAGFPFYRNGPPNVNDILDYAHFIRGSTRADVATQARPFISKSLLVLGLYNWLKTLHPPTSLVDKV